VVEHKADSYFSYFTTLTYIGLCAYFFASGVQTLVYACGKRRGYPLQRWPRFLQFLHVLLYATIVTYPILVSIVYWSLLADKDTFATRFTAFSNISRHALNTAFALFEILFTRAGPPPWLQLPLCFLMLCGYLGVAYITHATQGIYVYGFLDPQKQHGKLAAYIVGIAVAECIIFAIVYGICVLREKLISLSSHARASRGISSNEAKQGLDEWEELERPKTSAEG
jgi:uncharacterized membrane protein HdeD (DUF308 family)